MRLTTALLGTLLLASPAFCAEKKVTEAPPKTTAAKDAKTAQKTKATAPKEAGKKDGKDAKSKATVKEQNDPFLKK
jgi:hypothetical protein